MDHYTTLGINRNASPIEIKKAWKKIAVQCHPDRNPNNKNAEDKFKQAQAAYAILGNSDQKAKYDLELQFGGSTPIPNLHYQTWSTNHHNHDAIWDDFEEILKATGSAKSRHESYRESLRTGSDIDITLTITLEEAAKGCSREVEIPSREKIQCSDCFGKRATKGARIVCSRCMGSGRGLYFNNSLICKNCDGHGDIPKYPCEKCGGKGYIISKRKITVKIPSGIDNDHKLKLTQMGNPGNPPGDLYATIIINKHPVFTRNGQDLYQSYTIPFSIAMNGGSVIIPSLDGHQITMEIPNKIEPGKTMIKITGEGLKNLTTNQIGSMFVTIQVKLPELKTDRAKELFLELMNEITNQ